VILKIKGNDVKATTILESFAREVSTTRHKNRQEYIIRSSRKFRIFWATGF
jgi:hypothetical protein